MNNNGIVNIKGKEYQTVAFRVQTLREKFPQFGLRTSIVSADENYVVMRAEIYDDQYLLATGHAEERRNSSNINKTSALENCETSAIGRALAALGMGGTEFASSNEVQNAIHQQNKAINPDQVTEIQDFLTQTESKLGDFLRFAGAGSLEDIKEADYPRCIQALKTKLEKMNDS